MITINVSMDCASRVNYRVFIRLYGGRIGLSALSVRLWASRMLQIAFMSGTSESEFSVAPFYVASFESFLERFPPLACEYASLYEPVHDRFEHLYLMIS